MKQFLIALVIFVALIAVAHFVYLAFGVQHQ